MTKKEFLKLEAFAALPDDAEIVFNTSKHPEAREPFTTMSCWYEERCTNMYYIQNAPENIREQIEPKYVHFFIIDAMPRDYMKNRFGMTFDL